MGKKRRLEHHGKSKGVTEASSSSGNSNKQKKRKGSNVPKPGEAGYLTPNQLRKRRKKLQNNADPSMKYIKNPRDTPVVNQAIQYFTSKKKPFEVFIGPLKGWRTVSKLAVRRDKTTKKCVIGMFLPKSHDIIAVPNCAAHHPSINQTISYIQDICNDLNIEAYDESTGKGFLRYVCINVERSTKKSQVTLVWNSSPYQFQHENKKEKEKKQRMNDNDNKLEGQEDLTRLIDEIKQKQRILNMHSLWVHFNAQWKHASSIIDIGSNDLWKKYSGPDFINESLDLSGCRHPYPPKGKIELCFSPNVFRQANLDSFARIVVAIRNYIMKYNQKRNDDHKPKALELYGGVGTIALNICDLFSSLISSDENANNIVCFNQSLSYLRAKDYNAEHCSYIPKDATTLLKEFNLNEGRSEVIIVDPPRKGLDDFVLQSLISGKSGVGGPNLLVYISCGFKAFVRDCDALLGSEKWQLHSCEGHILFPGSDAIETLAFFRRT